MRWARSAMPGWHVGVGWLVAALAVAAFAVCWAIFGARRRAELPHSRGRSRRTGLGASSAGVAALVLAGGAGRAGGGWLAALCLLVAVPLASYALAGRVRLASCRGAVVRPPRSGWPSRPGAPAATAGGGCSWRSAPVSCSCWSSACCSAAPIRASRRWCATGRSEIRPGAAVRLVLGFVLVAALAAGAAHLVHMDGPTKRNRRDATATGAAAVGGRVGGAAGDADGAVRDVRVAATRHRCSAAGRT